MPSLPPVPDAHVPDVWEYHTRRASLPHTTVPRHSAGEAATPHWHAPAELRSAPVEATTPHWHAPLTQRPSVLHAAFQISSAPSEVAGSPGQRGLGTSRSDRVWRLGAATTMLVVSAALLLSGSWQQQTVAASPEEVTKVYATMMSILPGDHRVRRVGGPSRHVQPVFELQAGLFSAYVVNLCYPTGGFDSIVDRAACERKLEGFCDSLRDSTPNDKWLRAADKLHSTCLETIRGAQGISVPLLGGPIHQLWQQDRSGRRLLQSDGSAVDELRREFEVGPAEFMPNFCATVANCEQLEAMRPWNMLVLAAFIAAASAVAFGRDFLQPDPKQATRGLSAAAAAFVLFTVAGLLYLYVSKAYPVSSYIRSESLFYFMLSDPADLTPARRLKDAAWQAPAARWKGVLLSLTGSLIQGLVAGDMSQVYLQLKESVDHAWKLADVLFQRWLNYLRYAITQAPSDGTLLLRDAASRLEELDRRVLDLTSAGNSTEEDKLLSELSEELHKQVEQLLSFNSQAIQLVSDGEVLVHAVVRSWRELETPVASVIHRIQEAWKGRAFQQLLQFAKDVALDHATIADLKTIFTRLSETLPKIVMGTEEIGKDFRRLTGSFGPLVKGMRATLRNSSSCVRKLLRIEVNKTRQEALQAASGLLEELAKPDGLKKLAKMWSEFTSADFSDVFGDNASDPKLTGRLLSGAEQEASIASLVEPFAQAKLDPMARVDAIFLNELQNLGRNTGLRPMQEQHLCSWQMPSACTNLGLSFFCLVLVQVALGYGGLKILLTRRV